MNSYRLLWVMMALVALLFAGCATGPEDGDPGASVDGDGSGTTTTGIGPGGTWTGSALDNPNSPLYTKIIYFDFDQDTIRSEYIEVLRAHASYLISNSGSTVLVEGHADERGSREYNIALGERRANAVKRFFEAEGVFSSQIRTLSYGEERPAAFGHDEGSWAENRRAVLVY